MVQKKSLISASVSKTTKTAKPAQVSASPSLSKGVTSKLMAKGTSKLMAKGTSKLMAKSTSKYMSKYA